MSACASPSPGAPTLALTLVGSGEPLLRMEKRLHCAAAGAGLRLELEIRKDAEALGIPYAQTPAVLLNGQVMLRGLRRTEEIETWLHTTFTHEN
ncbi:thioredoxin family protein [Sulfurivermis fontis]|uniref:thioredoxin family protein n=1 Tax=Sulfurivermis fontis TaxID=1972068 RepID=UPI000FD6EFDE|nr:thioredoxin family protein [Sulfurivermis fontis]